MMILSKIRQHFLMCIHVSECVRCVQPTDLSDPNPVQMLMLCVHLYERLPHYLPIQTITLSGGLHSTFSKQVTHTHTHTHTRIETLTLF